MRDVLVVRSIFGAWTKRSALLARTAGAEAADPKLSDEMRAALEADDLLSLEDTYCHRVHAAGAWAVWVMSG